MTRPILLHGFARCDKTFRLPFCNHLFMFVEKETPSHTCVVKAPAVPRYCIYYYYCRTSVKTAIVSKTSGKASAVLNVDPVVCALSYAIRIRIRIPRMSRIPPNKIPQPRTHHSLSRGRTLASALPTRVIACGRCPPFYII